MTTTLRTQSPFGAELRYWRERRGVSQLRLATSAGMSPRYLSFVETGRSRPGRAVVDRLAEALDVPLRDRNRLFIAAGIPPTYRQEAFDDPALSPFRCVVEAMLRKHEPYPAFALDRDYKMLVANRAAHRLLPGLAHANWIDVAFAPSSPMRAAMENFSEVAWASLDIMRRESGAAREGLEPAIERLRAHLVDVPRPDHAPSDERVISPRLRFGDRVVTIVATIARFGAPRDVTIDELRVELMFPGDAESEAFFVEAAASEQ